MAIKIERNSSKKKPGTNGQAPEVKTNKPAVPERPALLPLVALREGVIFPHTENVLVFGRAQSKLAVEAAQSTHGHLIVVGQRNADTEDPKPEDLYTIGTLAKVERTLQHEGDTHTLIRGLKRVRVDAFQQTEPFPIATAKELKEEFTATDQFEAELKHLANLFKKTVQQGKSVEFFNFMKLVSGVRSHELVDHVASTLDIPAEAKQHLLEMLDVNKRIKAVITHLSREQHILDIEQKISDETKKQLDDRMKENILRERMQAIQKELGEYDEESELVELETRLKKAKMPKKVHEKVEKEIRRLRQMSPMHSEYSYILSWVETLLDLPWHKRSKETVLLKKAEKILDDQHYGLEKVKERVLEHLAVMQLRNQQLAASQKRKNGKANANDEKRKPTSARLPTILCFVGPPGVGKTSIGRSIAEALGREFVKVSLGGVRDEAEIRGHRRTYVGAMPGRIVQGMQQAGTINPVFILDEIDKLGADFRGDPSAAMLEVLDPEQNYEFIDHYLGVAYDLSNVMFITTANVLHTIPSALRDRLEIVEFSGYTHDEKFHIAQRYLISQATEGAGLTAKQLQLTPGALNEIIEYYTRESGVRNLKRLISKISRKVARKLAESKRTKALRVTRRSIDSYLGPRQFLSTVKELESQIGLVNGLAYTKVGGDILHIEAALSEGKEGFTLTGQLGDVMKESARAAYTYVRSKAEELGIDPKKFDHSHVHVHVPEGAVPKDGPSAGVALTMVLASVFSRRQIRHDVAMTGEVTLRGRVLAIGGLKEKLIAAHRAGITQVFIPKENEKDLREIPDNVKKQMKIVPVEHVREVIPEVLLPLPTKAAKKKTTAQGKSRKRSKLNA